MNNLWAIRMSFSFIADELNITAILKEVRQIAEKYDGRDILGYCWDVNHTFQNIHTGFLHVIVSSKTAAMFKLASQDHSHLAPLEEIL